MSNRIWVVLAFLVLYACGDGRSAAGNDADVDATAKTGYTILDSGFGSDDSQIYWLDESQVLFKGYSGPKPKTVEENQNLQIGLFIWDTKNNTVTRYSDVKSNFYCYGDGHIYYDLGIEESSDHPRGIWHYMYGPFRDEQEVVKVVGAEPDEYEWNKLACKRQQRPAAMQNRVWIPLREGDGYLDLGSIGPHNKDVPNAVLYTASNKQIPLRFSRNDVGTTSIRYYAFKKGYFLWQHVFGQPVVDGVVQQDRREAWMQTGCLAGWWVLPDGQSEAVCIPAGPWVPGAVAVIPAKVGLLIISKQQGRPGVYLSEDDTALKVINGYAEGAALSPDGCRIAFSHAADLEAMRVGGTGQRTLKLINLCNKS
jgi:hypothetical protein